MGGPRGRSGQVRKISPPPGFDPLTVQPIASRYTDWATGPQEAKYLTSNEAWALTAGLAISSVNITVVFCDIRSCWRQGAVSEWNAVRNLPATWTVSKRYKAQDLRLSQLNTTTFWDADSSWNVTAHGDVQEGKWRGNWRMQWIASTLLTTSEHGISSITTADAHTSAASSRLTWRPPADLNGLVRFAEKVNLVSARVPSHFNWPLTRCGWESNDTEWGVCSWPWQFFLHWVRPTVTCLRPVTSVFH